MESPLGSGLAGEAPGGARLGAGAGVENALGVDAAGEADEGVDRAEREQEHERVLPERHADERAAGWKDEGRGEREDGERVGEQAFRAGVERDVAEEEGGEK